jgi:A/G-specific adenine glycosylase
MQRLSADPPFASRISDWFSEHARDLPWRRPGTSAWAVLVSEVMLQQTPVNRVLPVYLTWLERWPTPAALAADSAGAAVRAWGKLGYPRRALRLHSCAVAIAERHDGQVPDALADLLALPGVGDYTARAVLAFAFGSRAPVVDINVRRVLARAIDGEGMPRPPSTNRDLAAIEPLLPITDRAAARFSAAIMELGALVCTASAPGCPSCPVAGECAWRLAGYPDYTGPTTRPQRFIGTDRQARGQLLDVLRAATGPVLPAELDLAWPVADQRRRALDSLIVDGLIDPLPDGRYALPG